MEREQELAIIRRACAKQIMAQAQVDNSRLEQAFAEVHREDFLGTGPWVIPRWFDKATQHFSRIRCKADINPGGHRTGIMSTRHSNLLI